MKSIKIYVVVAMLLLANIAVASPVNQSFTVPVADSASEGIAERALGDFHPDELWNLANTDYANGDYIGAERAYNEILSRGLHSASLYYNLGNVSHKRDELGRSLLYYYKALRLAPADRDILHNIEVVKVKTTDNIESLPRFFIEEWSEWLGARLSCMEWSILSLLLFALAVGLLLLYLLAESMRMRRIGFWSAIVLGLFFILSTRYALIERSELLNPSEAVVMSRSMSVKSSPNRTSTELFILHEGTKVEIVTTHDEWCEIMIEDGKKGWVESRRIEQI